MKATRRKGPAPLEALFARVSAEVGRAYLFDFPRCCLALESAWMLVARLFQARLRLRRARQRASPHDVRQTVCSVRLAGSAPSVYVLASSVAL